MPHRLDRVEQNRKFSGNRKSVFTCRRVMRELMYHVPFPPGIRFVSPTPLPVGGFSLSLPLPLPLSLLKTHPRAWSWWAGCCYMYVDRSSLHSVVHVSNKIPIFTWCMHPLVYIHCGEKCWECMTRPLARPWRRSPAAGCRGRWWKDIGGKQPSSGCLWWYASLHVSVYLLLHRRICSPLCA